MTGAAYGYGRVAPEGFLGLAEAFSSGAWASVVLPPREAGRRTARDLLGLPADVRWKLRAVTAVQALAAAVVPPPAGVTAEILDVAWDSSQRFLALEIELVAESVSVALADRLRAALLAGDDCAQTHWDYHREVDFGRQQVEAARTYPLAADIKAAGLGRQMREIEVRTEALAEGIGRGTEGGRPTSRWMRTRDALTQCCRALESIHGALDWDIEQSARGEDRDRLIALRHPLEALLEAYADAPDLFDPGVRIPTPSLAPTAAPPALSPPPLPRNTAPGASADRVTQVPPAPRKRPSRKPETPGVKGRKPARGAARKKK